MSTGNIQLVNLADNVNAAFDKINENFELVATGAFGGGLDSANVTNLVNQEYLSQFTLTTDVDLTDVEAGIVANASSLTTLVSRIDATDSSISVFAGNIDSVHASLLLLDSATNDRIDIQTNAVNSLTASVTANSNGLSAVVGDVTQLNIDLNQLITDGINLTPEQVTEAIGGALDSLTLRLDADSDNLTLEAAKITSLDAALTALDSTTGAEIQAEANARSALSATVALIDGRVTSQANDITALTSSVDSNFATVNQSLTTLANSSGASAVYALDLNVNNHIAGIRLDNNGSTANFAITADTFKIINASNNEIQPFTVSGNEVRLSNATVTGQLDIGTNETGSHMEITNDVISIFESNNIRVKLGKLS